MAHRPIKASRRTGLCSVGCGRRTRHREYDRFLCRNCRPQKKEKK